MDTAHEPTAPLDFADYLEAKLALDARSLNIEAWQACLARLGGRDRLRVLDVGSGTGAMVRRLAGDAPAAALDLTALDRDRRLLETARTAVRERLAQLGLCSQDRGDRVEAGDGVRRVHVTFKCCDLFDFEPPSPDYDLITAHAFMDLVPMARALGLYSRWLSDGGLLYATLNYDGETDLFPQYGDPGFEATLLAVYDDSMDRRRVAGEPTGGARSGRRLYTLLEHAGFEVVAYGSSDWNLTPLDRRYRARDADVLRMMLQCIRGEAEREPMIDRARLADWHARRSEELARGALGMIVHQIDILAARGAALTALT
jgi:SAM-dependent methyltransferase